MRLSAAALAAIALVFAAPPASAQAPAPAENPAGASADSIRVELNALESVQERCRMSFVIGNEAPESLDNLKLDLAVFNPDGIVHRRLVVELGPVRGEKTMVKAFELDSPCAQLGSILVNDVTECAPAAATACLDRLTLASRPEGIRFYK